MLAATNPFAFGEFEVFEGRNSYNVTKANIQNYFRELVLDLDAASLGFYFMEFVIFTNNLHQFKIVMISDFTFS